MSKARLGWTLEQEKILKDNPGMAVVRLQAMLAAIGPPRSAQAIDSKRSAMRIKGREAVREVVRPPNGGWPKTPPPERADAVFVRALLTAMLAEVRSKAA